MFIVLDGIDGAGKGRQRVEILNLLKKTCNIQIEGEEFPVHNSFYNNVIHPALQEETTMNNPSWVLAYLLDKTLQAPRIEPYVNEQSNLFLADGYFTTTIAYQSLLMNQINLDELLQYAVNFQIPTPDLTIYIDVDPKIAAERKVKEPDHEEGLDMFEKSSDKQIKLRKIFKKMVTEKIYCEWREIDGNGKVEEVTEQILNIIREKVNIE